LGRNIYNVGDLDTWQVLMFIKGVAGSGKSTLGKIAARFYNQADVAVISSNIEEKFGLAPIADKFMFVCLEVKEKFGLNQADL
jgi:ABC-type cobalamin/Fe3+-siderophores transport system ATPase subunit